MSEAQIRKAAEQLFSQAADQEEFWECFQNPPILTKAVAWIQERQDIFQPESPSPLWLPEFVQLVQSSAEPGKHSLHEDGAYYVLDVSSVWAVMVLSEIQEKPSCVLDVCAAPGGKAILSSKFFSPELLIANEVIEKRTRALISNLKRCKIKPCAVTSMDPSFLAITLEHSADLVLVDAPCSGQSLLIRGEKALGAFHSSTINMNAKRQRRIIANAAKCVRPGGHLAYMTCTFSRKENEKIVDWFLKTFPEFSPIPVSVLELFQSEYTDTPCYRLFPQQKIGAGAFTALFRRIGASPNDDRVPVVSDLPRVYWRNDTV